jgi:putative ABC transport system permease protein
MAEAIRPVSQPTITEQNQALAADIERIGRLGTPPTLGRGGGVPLSESFTSSLHSLSANVTRTILTMLGIIIGVASVIALLAYGNGVVAKALTALERNGTNLITIQGASQAAAGIATGNQSRTLTLTDAEVLADPTQCPDCGAVSPEVRGGGQITANGKNTFGAGIGVLPAFVDVHSYNVASGSFIQDTDVTGNQSVIVLGANIANTLFPGVDPTGQAIRLNRQSFRVIGVMEAKGGNGFGSLDNQVYVPITTALSKLTGGRGGAPTGAGKIVDTIYIKSTSPNTVDKAISEANDVLSGQHRTKTGAPDWQVTNQADQLQAAKDTQKTYQIFLFVIASISLLVGGIGIMNIMLVSVTERTREIGIRKAIGAKGKDIMTQFVTEAVLISLIGALTGVIFGLVAAFIVGKTWQRTIVSTQSVFVAVAFATATGLFFGVYPARRASRLAPIDALRYE